MTRRLWKKNRPSNRALFVKLRSLPRRREFEVVMPSFRAVCSLVILMSVKVVSGKWGLT